MKQFQFDFESMETPERSLAEATLPTPALENRYGSVKRVFLVYEGSLQDRPCITNTDDAKRLFQGYWKQHPANDQEQFVVACLDTKHRVQCVVKVTGRFSDAIATAARLLEPKVQTVRLSSGTLKTEDDIKGWLQHQEAHLLGKLKDGPIVIQ
jgi:hypothetical protein